MKTVTRKYKVCKFTELPEDTQDKVIEKLYDINVDYEWYDSTEEDAKQIGLEIEGFDTYRHTIEGKVTEDCIDVAKGIMAGHGEDCDTYRTAKNYITEYDKLEEDEDGDVDSEEIDAEFLHDILEDYLVILRKEYEYLTSREAIIETIGANDYEFTEDGNIF